MHTKAIGAVLLAAFALAGCSESTASDPSDPSVPTIKGAKPSIYARVECPNHGWGNVKVHFTTDSHAFIGWDPITGVEKTYSETFTLTEGDSSPFTITVSPGEGKSCKTTLTDDATSEVVVSKSTNEDVTLKVLLKRTR